MAYEDFDGWTELDPSGHIAKADYVMTATGLNRNEDAWLYYDYGADYFEDFEHKLKARVASGSTWSFSFPWLLSNYVDDQLYLQTNSKSFLGVSFTQMGHINRRIELMEVEEGGSFNGDSWAGVALNTYYYFTIERIGTAFQMLIYDDSERTNLLDTLNITLQVDTHLRYCFVATTRNSAENQPSNFTSENLEFVTAALEGGGYTASTYRMALHAEGII